MRIGDLFGRGKAIVSFEFFPPKTDAGLGNLERAIADLAPLAPGYVSVTYGAGGSTRDRTVDMVVRLQKQAGLRAMAHLTCAGASQAELGAIVDRLVAEGVENIIALRGDPPTGTGAFVPHPEGFAHASDLVAFIRARHGKKVCLAAACYPETHLETRDPEQDMLHTRTKVNAGVDFLVTQMFFDNRHYFDFVARARTAGITVPIVPGIMPITNVAQIERFTKLCGASIPEALGGELERSRNDPQAALQLGVAHATAQCVGLLAGGAPGVHFFTLNQSPATRVIHAALRAARLV